MLNGDTPGDYWTLAQVQDWLRARSRDGERCPCCQQWSQTYFRSINAAQARGAIVLYHWQMAHPGEFCHLPSVVGRRSSEEHKLAYWSLLEEEPAARPDGGRTGRWRLTNQGVEWVRGKISVPWYALIYADRVLGFSQESRSGQHRGRKSVRDALGEKFDYDKLMRGEG